MQCCLPKNRRVGRHFYAVETLAELFTVLRDCRKQDYGIAIQRSIFLFTIWKTYIVKNYSRNRSACGIFNGHVFNSPVHSHRCCGLIAPDAGAFDMRKLKRVEEVTYKITFLRTVRFTDGPINQFALKKIVCVALAVT